jgi:hypothetical protein
VHFYSKNDVCVKSSSSGNGPVQVRLITYGVTCEGVMKLFAFTDIRATVTSEKNGLVCWPMYSLLNCILLTCNGDIFLVFIPRNVPRELQ